MADDVVIRLSGDTGALVAAINQATDYFTRFRQTLSTTADTAKVFGETFAQQAQAWLAADDNLEVYRAKLNQLNEAMALTREQQDISTQSIRDYTEQLSLTRQTMTTLDEASRLLGESFATQSQEWLAAASSADEYAARLAYIREQIAYTQDQLALMNGEGAAAGGMGGLSNLSGFFGNGLSGMMSSLDSMGLLGEFGGPLGMLAGGIDSVVGGMTDFVSQSAAFIGAMAGWTIIQDVTSWVQQLSSELFNLNVQTEKAGTGWSYMLGGGPKQQGVQQSHDLMQWLSQFSLDIPFTKQDAMSGATALISLGGANEQETKALLGPLADIAATYGSATHGGQGTTLAQAAYAVAMFAKGGQSRMLKQDLGITPEMLMKYGLVGTMTSTGVHVSDPNSVYRALINFDKANVPGAAQGIANSTWWGGWSSLVDNFQNLLTEIGGTNMDGTIRKGSFFATIKADLTQLLQWFGSHQGELQSFADTVSKLFGNAVNGLGGIWQTLSSSGARNMSGVFTSFWQGLTSSGVGQTLLGDVKATIQWLANPENQHMVEQMGFILGQGIGDTLKTIATTLGGLVTNGTQLMQSLRPDDLALIAGAFSELSLYISLTGDAITFLAREMLDLVHISEDLSKNDYAALAGDVGQSIQDNISFGKAFGNDLGAAGQQSTQMQVSLWEWQQQHPGGPHQPTSKPHTLDVGAGATGSSDAAHWQRIAASVSDMHQAVVTSATQSAMNAFARGIILAAGPMGDVGRQIAAVIGDAITEHVSAQFRTQSHSQAMTTRMPGSFRSFGVFGA